MAGVPAAQISTNFLREDAFVEGRADLSGRESHRNDNCPWTLARPAWKMWPRIPGEGAAASSSLVNLLLDGNLWKYLKSKRLRFLICG